MPADRTEALEKNLHPSAESRLWQIDWLRGFTVILMFFYHLVFDLIKIIKLSPFVGDWFFVFGPDLIGGIFLFASGLSSFARTLKATPSWRSSFKYAGRVFIWGAVLSAASYFYSPKTIIVFGILQCIAFSIILGTPFLRVKILPLVSIALAVIVAGYVFEHSSFYLTAIQWVSAQCLGGRRMMDFFWIIPWFGFYLLGVAFGKSSIFEKIRKKTIFRPYCKPIVFLGRHSLAIYIVHQPILLGILFLVFRRF